MKLTRILLLSICLSLLLSPLQVKAKPSVSARNAVLMEQETGRVLYEKQAHEKRNIASITKIMTAIIAIESGMMEDTVKTSKRAVYTEGSSIYLEEGEKMKLEDLVYGLMLRSGNDAAMAIAEHVGGSMEGFVYLMNQKAEWIGMKNSHFANPHGLDAEGHYSTAYDMALLTRYAMDNEVYREIAGTTTYKSDTRTYAWGNKNKLLTKLYDHSTGGKTGFTKTAGRTLVSTAEKNGMNLIMVTLNGPDDWNDHIHTFNWGFDTYKMRDLKKEGEQSLGSDDKMTGYIWDSIKAPLTDEEFNEVKATTHIQKPTDYQSVTPILGHTIFEVNGEVIAEASVMANPAPEPGNKDFASSVFSFFKNLIGAN
ncbi:MULTISPECIES: D-alanyl-D-alanine carboxypeptidase family protein [Pontibacillus]|uniref:D-alanyl-D-alanine carboxypeptidase family protein n=1 Tax=Pontibacillus chungwhensis TaxID=265426 RepID=A0ABY8USF5_9BACI|nr:MULTISPECIES: D-alanyl-D-alanine carboxypeptidase family protein [Pontibacillus]WIF96439.1 D-alanyl-D-alanine carboxypeptidase family protein [Pontibacillus chungwhensis]